MTSVIRSTRVDEEPRMLVRAPRRESPRNAGNVDPAVTLFRVGDQDSARGAGVKDSVVSADGMSPVPSVAGNGSALSCDDPPPAAVPVSYEEYQARFREELDELRAQLREAAHREGHAEGMIEGRNAGEAMCSEKFKRLELLTASAQETVEQRLDGLVDTAVEIVFESVVKILGEQFADKAGTEAVVREVIRQSKERNKLVVRISPSDYEMLADNRAELTDGLNIGQVEFIADDLIELGGCVLETPSGSLDGRLEIQMQRLRETLLNARMKWHEHGD